MSDSATIARPSLVLIADDQEWSARSLESLLGPAGYAVLRSYTGRQTLEIARSTRPDVVILDLGLPDVSGLEVCETLRESVLGASTPIVMTTASSVGRAERLAALRAGAWDFFAQPLDVDILLAKLATYVASRRELEVLSAASLLDQVTGLYNAQGLARRAREVGAEAMRRHAPLACVALAAEPTMPGAADESLEDANTRIAEHLTRLFRQCGRLSDIVGRLGRSEFAIIAPETEAPGVVRLVERLQQTLSAEPMVLPTGEVWLRLRAGYAAVPNLAEASVDAVELLLRAAAALRHERSSTASGRITDFSQLSPSVLN